MSLVNVESLVLVGDLRSGSGKGRTPGVAPTTDVRPSVWSPRPRSPYFVVQTRLSFSVHVFSFFFLKIFLSSGTAQLDGFGFVCFGRTTSQTSPVERLTVSRHPSPPVSDRGGSPGLGFWSVFPADKGTPNTKTRGADGGRSGPGDADGPRQRYRRTVQGPPRRPFPWGARVEGPLPPPHSGV